MSLFSFVQSFPFDGANWAAGVYTVTGKTFTANNWGVVGVIGPKDTIGGSTAVNVGGQNMPQIGTDYLANGYIVQWYGVKLNAGLTGTITCNAGLGGGSTLVEAVYLEVSHANPISVDTGSSASGLLGSTGTTPDMSGTAPTMSPVAGNPIAIFTCMSAGTGNPIGPPGGGNNLVTSPTGAGVGGLSPVLWYYKFVDPSSGTYNSTNTFSFPADWASGSIVLKATASAASGLLGKGVIYPARQALTSKQDRTSITTFSRAPFAPPSPPTPGGDKALDDLWFFRNRRRYR